MIQILSRNQINTSEYKELVTSSENPLFYSDLNYLDAIAKFTKSELYFVVDSDNEQYVNVLPFCMYRGRFGPVINSLPFYGSNGGIIAKCSDRLVTKKLLDVLFAFAMENRCISITLIESPFHPLDTEERNRFNFYDSRIGQFKFLSPSASADDLVQSFQDPRPRNIRKAEKAGVLVVQSQSRDSIDFLAQTHIENMTTIGGLAKAYNFFEDFLTDLPPEKWCILEAVYEGQRIASLLLLYNERVIEYFTPATVSKFRSLQAQSLLIHKGMLFAISQGISIWNWGGTWHSQKGVYDFKRKWGSIESNYGYYCAVLDYSILKKEPQEFQLLYPNFYVVPFSALKG